MSDGGDEQAAPFRRRARRERTSARRLPPRDLVERQRAIVRRLQAYSVDDLSRPDDVPMLAAEAALVRAKSLLDALPADLLRRPSQDAVSGLTGMRNVAAHGCGRLRPDRVHAVLASHLPVLLDEITQLLDEYGEGPGGS